MKTCPWCDKPIPNTPADATSWYCPTCKRFDALACLACGMTDGFPHKDPWVSQSDLAKSPQNGTGPFDRRQYVYCEWDFHGAYFVAQNGPTSSCRLCGTEWDRLKSAAHAPAVKMRA